MNNKKNSRFMPLAMALCVVIGILIGTFYANHFSGNRLSIINSSSNKLNNLLHIIDDQYVDTVNVNDLVEKAMPQILAELDPHSVYISAKDVQIANDDLRGSFSGVGIEFVIREDTLHVQQVVSNGPAERAGVIAGDKVVTVDGKPFTGKTLTNEEASRSGIRSGLNELFAGEGAIALFYFSGHGIDDKNDGFIVSQNFERDDYGIPMSEILRIASQSKFTYKIIILDCCHSGFMGNYGIIGETSALSEGTVIMTASRKDESAIEVSGHGVFTNLLIEALKGGASDVLGNVTPGSIYAFIDQALGQWAQRPLFKANI